MEDESRKPESLRLLVNGHWNYWEPWRAPYERYYADKAKCLEDSFNMDTETIIPLLDGYAAEAERRAPEIDEQLKRLRVGIDVAALLDAGGVMQLKATFWTEDRREILVEGFWDLRPQAYLIIRRKDDGHDDRREEAIEFLQSNTALRKQQRPALEKLMGRKVSRAEFRDLCREAGLREPGGLREP